MEVPDHKYKVRLIVQLHESCPVLIVNPERVKTFIATFEGFEVEGWMEGIGEK